MKILHLISSSGFFGAEKVALNLMSSLKEESFEPYLVCLKNSAKPDPEIHFQAKSEGISADVISCRGKFDIGTIGRIREFIDTKEIQLVHSHGYKSNFYGLVASRLSKVPIVATLHGWTGENNKVRFYEGVDKWIIRRMDHLISVSPLINEELKKSDINGGNVSLIPNGIDAEKFNPANTKRDLRNRFNLKNDLVIGTAGRLSSEKGHIDLLKAFKGVCSLVSNVKLLIVGEGPLRESLKEKTRELGIEKNVVFAGVQKDMAPVYKAMDIFTLPSRTEGLPLALLEAMGMELPIIAAEVGGIPHVIDREEGILIPSGDIEELRNAILALLKNSDLRKRMGEKAREKVLSRFSLQRFYEGYKEVYNRVLSAEIALAASRPRNDGGKAAPMTRGAS